MLMIEITSNNKIERKLTQFIFTFEVFSSHHLDEKQTQKNLGNRLMTKSRLSTTTFFNRRILNDFTQLCFLGHPLYFYATCKNKLQKRKLNNSGSESGLVLDVSVRSAVLVLSRGSEVTWGLEFLHFEINKTWGLDRLSNFGVENTMIFSGNILSDQEIVSFIGTFQPRTLNFDGEAEPSRRRPETESFQSSKVLFVGGGLEPI